MDITSLRKGAIYTEEGELYKVLEYRHTQKGRGGATIRIRAHNMRSGSIVEKTYKSGSQVDDVRLDHVDSQYLYNDGDLYYFMNTDTFEQFAIASAVLTDITPYLNEGITVNISSYQGEPINIDLPTTIDMEVVEAEPGYAGNTAQGATKTVKVATGLSVQTPLFINVGDTIRIDTRSGEYLSRM